tara:strand:- start:580 stop:1389 length:810 start_codon:yes stop_codon:yes gene_type:complete
MKNYFPEALELIQNVGEWIYKEKKRFSSTHIQVKSLNSFVSYIDIEAEKKLIQGLKLLIPDAGFIAEEDQNLKASDAYNWIIDPLDGTTNYIHDLAHYSISVALLNKDEIVWSAVYDVSNFKMYSAEKGMGAFCNGKKLSIQNGNEMHDGIIGTGFPYYDFSYVDSYLSVLKKCFEHSRGVRRFGSAAIDLSLVAEGKFVAFFEYGLAPWDIAAGILLVRESGGIVSKFDGKQIPDRNLLFERNIVAANSASYKTLINWTSENFKETGL